MIHAHSAVQKTKYLLVVLSVLLLPTSVLLLPTSATSADDIKSEIINRCRKMMGEYGASLVKACVDQDIEAVNSLVKYPEKYRPIIARCMRQMRSYGFSLVKACADQDIEAEEALKKY